MLHYLKALPVGQVTGMNAELSSSTDELDGLQQRMAAVPEAAAGQTQPTARIRFLAEILRRQPRPNRHPATSPAEGGIRLRRVTMRGDARKREFLSSELITPISLLTRDYCVDSVCATFYATRIMAVACRSTTQ
jgi:hypothetical protein